MPFLTQDQTNWKFIAIVAALTVIVGAGIFGYLRTMEEKFEIPPADIPEKAIEEETVHWLIYKDEEYGFKIEYPEEWMIVDIEFMTPLLTLEKKEGKQDEKEIAEIEIRESTDNVFSLEELINEKIKLRFTKDSTVKEINIAGEKGYELIAQICTSICIGGPEDVYSTFVYVYFFHNDKIYTGKYVEAIKGVGWKESIEDYNYYDEFKKIISTFRFIEKTVDPEISPRRIPLEARSCSIESHSPDNKYLLVDCGTSPIRSMYIFDARTKKEMATFTRCGSNYAWLNNEEVIFSEAQKVAPIRPYGGGEGCGISLINVKDDEKKVLQEATALKDYNVIKILEDDNIHFCLREVNSPEDWADQKKVQFTYWIMDKNGNIIKEIFEDGA